MTLTAKNITRMKKEKKQQGIIKHKIKILEILNPHDLVNVKINGLKTDFEEEIIKFGEAGFTREEIADFGKIDVQRVDKIRAKYKEKLDTVKKNKIAKLFQAILKEKMVVWKKEQLGIEKRIENIDNNKEISDDRKWNSITNLLKLKMKIEESHENTVINLAKTWKLMGDGNIEEQRSLTDKMLDELNI